MPMMQRAIAADAMAEHPGRRSHGTALASVRMDAPSISAAARRGSAPWSCRPCLRSKPSAVVHGDAERHAPRTRSCRRVAETAISELAVGMLENRFADHVRGRSATSTVGAADRLSDLSVSSAYRRRFTRVRNSRASGFDRAAVAGNEHERFFYRHVLSH